MRLVLGGEVLEAAQPLRGKGGKDGTAVSLGRGAAAEALSFQPVHDGGGIAVRDEEHPRKLGHGHAVRAAVERGHHVEAGQGSVVSAQEVAQCSLRTPRDAEEPHPGAEAALGEGAGAHRMAPGRRSPSETFGITGEVMTRPRRWGSLDR